MRLIDADALMEALPETSVDIFENCRNCKLLDKDDVIDIIEAAPTIEPVKTGKWIDPAAEKCYRCSVCEEYTTMEIPRLLYHYCPNCGARMEKDDETN